MAKKICNNRLQSLFFLIVLFNLLACNNQSSIIDTMDSTKEVIDSQKSLAKDSIAQKSDSNERVIDSTAKIMKDSMKQLQ